MEIPCRIPATFRRYFHFSKVPTSMDSLDNNMTSEGYDSLRNDSMNNSLNSNMTSSYSSWDCDMLYFIVFTGVGGPMCVIGFLANIICYNVLNMDSGKKQSAATFLLQALAVADNFVLTFSFFNLSIIHGLLSLLGTRGKIESQVILVYLFAYVSPFATMTMTVTVWITVLIAINRYIAVCWPLDAHRLASLMKTKIQVAVVVALAIIFDLPLFFQYTILYPEDYDAKTIPSLIETSIGPNTLFGLVYKIVFDRIGLLIVPLILLLVFNTKIIRELRKVDKCRDDIQQNGSRSENNITVVMVVIVIVFIVSNIPAHIIEVANYFIDLTNTCSGWYTVWCVSQVFLVANSSTNFVVYYVLRKSFRHAFRKALSCCQPQGLVV